MTSGEKILAGILGEAKKDAEAVIKEAEEKAALYAAEAERKAQAKKAAVIADAEKKAEVIRAAGVSSAELIKRDRALGIRMQAISDILSETERRIAAMKDEDYFEFIADLVKKSATQKQGEILLSESDLKRNTDILKEKLSGCSLTLSDTPAEITSGFVLKYGDIMINGDIKAIIHEKRDILVDSINRTLFA